MVAVSILHFRVQARVHDVGVNTPGSHFAMEFMWSLDGGVAPLVLCCYIGVHFEIRSSKLSHGGGVTPLVSLFHFGVHIGVHAGAVSFASCSNSWVVQH